MLSLGMEYERAFSIAFWSARLPAGSPPPSRAATMIARESLGKRLPRFTSAAPLLCLIDDHLLCPDMHLLPDQVQERLVNSRIVGQLRVERRHDDAPLAHEDRLAAELGEHLDLRPGVAHARGADEDAAERPRVAGDLEVGLEAGDLPAVGVAVDVDVDEPEVRAVEHDHPGAGAEDGAAELAHRVLEPVEAHEPHERRRLATRDDEAVEALELLGLAHLDRVGAEPAQHGGVLAHVSLQGENADTRPVGHPASVLRGVGPPASRAYP